MLRPYIYRFRSILSGVVALAKNTWSLSRLKAARSVGNRSAALR